MNEFEILAELIGIPDLKTQNRNQENSTARQAIAFLLHKEGFSEAEIGVMQGRSRTIIQEKHLKTPGLRMVKSAE